MHTHIHAHTGSHARVDAPLVCRPSRCAPRRRSATHRSRRAGRTTRACGARRWKWRASAHNSWRSTWSGWSPSSRMMWWPTCVWLPGNVTCSMQGSAPQALGPPFVSVCLRHLSCKAALEHHLSAGKGPSFLSICHWCAAWEAAHLEGRGHARPLLNRRLLSMRLHGTASLRSLCVCACVWMCVCLTMSVMSVLLSDESAREVQCTLEATTCYWCPPPLP